MIRSRFSGAMSSARGSVELGSNRTEMNAPDADWSELEPGDRLEIVKLAPDRSVAARYPGTVIEYDAGTFWLVVRATWVMHEVETDGLRFVPGDELHEFFSPRQRFNVFSVFAPDGALRGWYANVTHPARLDLATEPPTLFWHDLYVDVIVLPDGGASVRDEDELANSNLESTDPALHAVIRETRDMLIAVAAARAFPFHER